MNGLGSVIIISGPSGAGKSTAIRRILEIRKDVYFSVSATTRAKRPGEIDGVNYLFVSQETFDGMVERGELLEYAGYVNHCYGTPALPVKEALEKGQTVLLDIEVQGAVRIKSVIPEAVLVFLIPSRLSTLRKRLSERSTEEPEVVENRIKTAMVELEQICNYDYVVFNDDLQEAVRELDAIITAARCRRSIRAPQIETTM